MSDISRPTPLSPERLAEIKDLLKYESSISFQSTRAKESMLLLIAEVEQWWATYGRDALPGALDRLNRAEAEVERLTARVAELEAAAGRFLQWTDRLDDKSLDNFLVDLSRATEYEPMSGTVAEIEETVTHWRALAEAQPVDELEAAGPHRFEAEFQGVSDAKRRLANCKHCHGARTDARHTEGGLS